MFCQIAYATNQATRQDPILRTSGFLDASKFAVAGGQETLTDDAAEGSVAVAGARDGSPRAPRGIGSRIVNPPGVLEADAQHARRARRGAWLASNLFVSGRLSFKTPSNRFNALSHFRN